MEKENNYKEDWDYYLSKVDGVIGSFFVDLGLRKIAPVADRPNMVWVSITMQNPREDGLSSNEECNLLYEIEDNLVNNIADRHGAIYAGRLTSDGMRQLFFYFGDMSSCEETITQSMSKYPAYEFKYGNKEDKEWNVYIDFMHPSPRQCQIIMNGRVIRNLEKHGDNLTKERMVDHWIYFKSENDMKNYIAEIESQNFQVIDSHQNDEKIYVLNIERVDKVDYHSVNDYTLYLWELAGKHNGNYDGWGCNVVKELS